MAKLMVHLTFGPEAPTRGTLACLLAKTAAEEGHDVTLFFGGDAVQLLRPATIDATQGVGTGQLRDHLDALVAAGGKICASKMSSDARALSPDDLGGLDVRMVKPTDVIQLTLDHDRVISY